MRSWGSRMVAREFENTPLTMPLKLSIRKIEVVERERVRRISNFLMQWRAGSGE
jgi:hypothetical protein